MVWVLRKELEYKVEKLKYLGRLEVMHPRIRTKSELPELVMEPFCLSPHRSFTVEIDCTVYHLLVKNN